jgi:hypothetical protein
LHFGLPAPGVNADTNTAPANLDLDLNAGKSE